MNTQLLNPFLTCILILAALWAHGQTYEPTILVLSPNNSTAATALQPEIDAYNKMLMAQLEDKIKEAEAAVQKYEGKENYRLMAQQQLLFAKGKNFYGDISSFAESYLVFRLYERFQNLLIYAVKDQCDGALSQLGSLDQQHQMQYVLNFPTVKSYVDAGGKKTTVRVQLYDHNQQLLVLDQEYTGHDRKPRYGFICPDSTLQCTINNAVGPAVDQIIEIVLNNSPTIIRERELADARAQVLFADYYQRQPAEQILTILTQNKPGLAIEDFYHGFMNDDKTKFVAFFASNTLNFKQLTGDSVGLTVHAYNYNKAVEINAFVMAGVYYQAKWYIQPRGLTHFNADNIEAGRWNYFNELQFQNFFKADTTVFNPDFWDTHYFEKVKDLTKEPDYEQRYEMYKPHEIKNRGYIGMYTLVADQLRARRIAMNSRFKTIIEKAVLLPFIKRMQAQKPDQFADYAYAMIIPEDRSVVLVPFRVEDSQGQKELRYFVVIPNGANNQKLYEWVYFAPKTLAQGADRYISDEIEGQLAALTDWSVHMENLTDASFWQQYVLLKEGGQFKYLKSVP